ncbi:MAG: hypothetical protein AAB923_03645 [Patescibacteria group bacterium]
MQTDQQMRSRIMARVYWIYAIRQIAQPTVRAILFLSACLAVTSLVSVQNVIANVAGMSSVSRVTDFFLSAFAQAELFVQAPLVLAALILIWSAVDLVRVRTQAPAHA